MKLSSTNQKHFIVSYLAAVAAFLGQQQAVVAGMDTQGGKYGQFLQCPSNEYMLEYCSSGENADCGKNEWTIMGCGAYPKPEKTTTPTSDVTSFNGWMCAKYGVSQECPEGYVMVGACGSGKNADCKEYCDDPSYGAIKCAPAPTGSATGPDDGTWSEPLKYGVLRQCPTDQVMCGVCQSGENHDCQGGWWRQKCCDIKPYTNKGSWQQIFSISNSTSHFTYSYGTTKSDTTTNSTQWNDSVTASVTASMTVEGIGGASTTVSGTISQQFGSSDSRYWSMWTTDSMMNDYDASQNGMEVWQWSYEISDPYGNLVKTMSLSTAITPNAATPPKCLPGYQKPNTDYQECISADGTLPGARRRSLRGQV